MSSHFGRKCSGDRRVTLGRGGGPWAGAQNFHPSGVPRCECGPAPGGRGKVRPGFASQVRNDPGTPFGSPLERRARVAIGARDLDGSRDHVTLAAFMRSHGPALTPAVLTRPIVIRRFHHFSNSPVPDLRRKSLHERVYAQRVLTRVPNSYHFLVGEIELP